MEVAKTGVQEELLAGLFLDGVANSLDAMGKTPQTSPPGSDKTKIIMAKGIY